MKRNLFSFLVLGMIVLVLSAAAFADPGSEDDSDGGSDSEAESGGAPVPEIDPATMGAAVTLLSGGLAILLSRRREK